MKASKKKVFWISAANVAACISVVILHSNGIFWSFPSGRLWYTSNFLETFFYWAVPVFFMISGTTLLEYRKKYTTKIYFQKRITRTVFPFIVWSVLAVLYRWLDSRWPMDGIRYLVSNVFNTKFMSIYWFFIPLFAAYLVIPLLAAVEDQLKEQVYLYAVIIIFLFVSLLPTIFSLLGIEYNVDIQMPFGGGYVLYVLLGYLISRREMPRNVRAVVYVLAVFGWALQYFGTSTVSIPAGKIVSTFKGYTNFPAVLQAVGVFTAFRYIPWEKIMNGKTRTAVNNLSKYTFGVYLIHYFIIDKLIESGVDNQSILFRTVGAFAIFVASALICWLLSMIPIVRKCVGC